MIDTDTEAHMRKIMLLIGLSLLILPIDGTPRKQSNSNYTGARHTLVQMSKERASQYAPTGTLLGDTKYLFTIEYFRFFDQSRDYVKLTNLNEDPFVLSHAEYVLKGKRISSKKVKDKESGGEREKTSTKTQATYCTLLIDEQSSTGYKTDRGYVIRPKEYLVMKPSKCKLMIDYLSFTDMNGYLYYYDE